jgi:GR25 family glycosyltransferase involved in LPS biosynthesis
MRSFIIVLENHFQSQQLANIALASSKSLGWQLEVFPAVDGRSITLDTLKEYNLKLNTDRKKVYKQFHRPGVLGCFLSQWILWNKCIELNKPIAIFEHDVEFKKPPPTNLNFKELLKLDGFNKMKPEAAGTWYVGNQAYIIKPTGARKIINWAYEYGILPADIMFGEDVIDIQFDYKQRVVLSDEGIPLSTTNIKSF